MEQLVQSELALRLIMATVLGAALGLERTIAGKQAGMRTYALVALGSCLFTLASTLGSFYLSMFNGTNPMQIASSIVVGIGFIGAGLAAVRGESHAELTTATGIWVAAAVGMATGYGLYFAAVLTAILVVLIFSFLLRIENVVRRKYGTEER